MIHVNEDQPKMLQEITICNLLYAHFNGRKSMLIGETCSDSFEKDAEIFAFVMTNPKIEYSFHILFSALKSQNVDLEKFVCASLRQWKKHAS